MARHVRTSLVLATAGLAAAAALLTPAAADAATNSVTGDVTGDGIKDRVTLTQTGSAHVTCRAEVRVGNGDGTFAAAVTVTLQTPENDQEEVSRGALPRRRAAPVRSKTSVPRSSPV